MNDLPRNRAPDSAFAFLSEGYDFIGNRCDRMGTDAFATRLMLRRAVCVRGEDAARMFYERDRFTRRGALPPTALRLLQGQGSVATLDGDAHRHRKAMFMSLMSPEGIGRLVEIFAEEWHARLRRWEREDEVALHPEVQTVLCRAVCRWAGVPLAEDEADERAREFAGMIDGAGAVGPRNWLGLVRRLRNERWARGIIEDVRAGRRDAAEGSALRAVATQTEEPGGPPLDIDVATKELLNVLRPTVAVARFITFAALALHQHAQTREAMADADDTALEHFAHEVRRFYPFFPVVAGHSLVDFEWRGHHFPEGTWVVLDLYGTNHDPRIWDAPGEFRPDRFRDWDGSPFNFVPQGGGDTPTGHRCPGERITIELVKRATRLLLNEMRYTVPEQDLNISKSRFPTKPKSGFLVRDVRGLDEGA